MSMWLQSTKVRHLVPTGYGPVAAICGATPRTWFATPPGEAAFVFSGPRSSRPADMSLPVCKRCQDTLAQLTQDNR